MKKIKFIAMIVVITIISISVKAQKNERIELSPDFKNVAVYPVENKGVLILEKIKNDRKNIELKVTFLDKNLEVKWTKNIDNQDFKLDKIKTSEDKAKVYISFYSGLKENKWSHKLLYDEMVRITSFSLENGDDETMDAKLTTHATLEDFGSTGELLYAIFLDKGFSKTKAFAMTKSIKDKKSFTVNIGEGLKITSYIGSYTLPSDGSIYTMLTYVDKEKGFSHCEIEQITPEGKMVKTSKKTLSEEIEWPFDCEAFHNDNSINLFGYDMQFKASNFDLIEPASAFSMIKVEDNKASLFATTNFGELNTPMISLRDDGSFLNLEKKIKENKAKKGKLNQPFNIITHPTIKSGDLYYTLFESYAPIYEVTTVKNPSGKSTSEQKKYKETFFPHLQVACFDIEGNLKWDNNCKLFKFTRNKGNANSTWQVDEDGIVSAIVHTDNYQIFVYKAKDGSTLKEEKSTFRDVLNENEWKDMVSGRSIALSGSQFQFAIVAIPFSIEKNNWLVCYITQKDRKSPYYLTFKPYKF